MKFYLIRHGQTQWNIDGKIQGKTDIPLNDTGILQARLLANALKDTFQRDEAHPAAVYTSVLQRAVQTAEIVAEVLGKEPVFSPRKLAELREVDFGLWEGKRWSEVECLYPDDFHLWEANPAVGTPTGGESRTSCEERCQKAVERILTETAETDGDIVLVAHGGILAYVIAYLLRFQKDKQEIIVTNASITTVEYDRKTGAGSLLVLNDTAHLGQSRNGKTNKYC